MSQVAHPDGVEIRGPVEGRFGEILTDEALGFLAGLHREFEPRRRAQLAARAERQVRLDAGERPDFSEATKPVREGDWRIAPAPPDLQDRRVEITGPTDRKMVINALNSGARCFMADFEDANAPTWHNMVDGQINVADAIRRTIRLTSPDGRDYQLDDEVATLIVRPRGWHLVERHVRVDGSPVSASLFDFGLAFFHNAAELLNRGSGPYYYLPKMEGHLEARLWNDVFTLAEDHVGIDPSTIRATVLIETILAAFEMDEILYELRDRSAGLNAGRWDYIFSVIKKFRRDPAFLLPDRAQVTMTVPFMRAYADLLVRTCHRRGAHAMGGMAAYIPSRSDAEANELALAKVSEDKTREAGAGFDGTWVAHPDLVETAEAEFGPVLGDRANQVERLREDVAVTAEQLLDVRIPDGNVTAEGLNANVSVGLQYIASWLSGVGAAAINDLMEDAATAEISRSQLWQWIHNGATLSTGEPVTEEMVRAAIDAEIEKLRETLGDDGLARYRFAEARSLFEQVALSSDFVEFLTMPAYDLID
jgi:malate synthase